ncbi:MAG TPA: DUF1049 domain-containing protein [Desulfotomaculum sp.]|nr:MAG: hypothetical protein XD84_0770 [Desulfotomaculum sp. 46_80]KUK84986.1 MAG: hypothetical protein XE00_0337 [Desulfofundulus kuznetsovii]HAG10437.1 DUF1049 domain-containing protein [Desulfotomaculum sp.]HBY04027.1 DUF1049 domain-containing protein [Desulfotomaculum sp.]
MKKYQVYFLMAIVFAVIIFIFSVQNAEGVSINFLLWKVQNVSKIVIILISALLGSLITICSVFVWQIKKWSYILQLEAQIKDLKKKLEAGNPKPS